MFDSMRFYGEEIPRYRIVAGNLKAGNRLPLPSLDRPATCRRACALLATTKPASVDNARLDKAAKTRRRKAAEPSPYHHGDLRNELVRQGRLFLETAGASEISMPELARRCGVSESRGSRP